MTPRRAVPRRSADSRHIVATPARQEQLPITGCTPGSPLLPVCAHAAQDFVRNLAARLAAVLGGIVRCTTDCTTERDIR